MTLPKARALVLTWNLRVEKSHPELLGGGAEGELELLARAVQRFGLHLDGRLPLVQLPPLLAVEHDGCRQSYPTAFVARIAGATSPTANHYAWPVPGEEGMSMNTAQREGPDIGDVIRWQRMNGEGQPETVEARVRGVSTNLLTTASGNVTLDDPTLQLVRRRGEPEEPAAPTELVRAEEPVHVAEFDENDEAVEMGPLSPEEQDRLVHLEGVVGRGLQAFKDAGQALLEIREEKLFRANHRSFSGYLRERWPQGRSEAYRAIGVAVTLEKLSPIGDGLPLPSVRSHLVELEGLDQETTQVVWRRALALGGGRPEDVTAAMVRQARQELAPRPAPPAPAPPAPTPSTPTPEDAPVPESYVYEPEADEDEGTLEEEEEWKGYCEREAPQEPEGGEPGPGENSVLIVEGVKTAEGMRELGINPATLPGSSVTQDPPASSPGIRSAAEIAADRAKDRTQQPPASAPKPTPGVLKTAEQIAAEKRGAAAEPPKPEVFSFPISAEMQRQLEDAKLAPLPALRVALRVREISNEHGVKPATLVEEIGSFYGLCHELRQPPSQVLEWMREAARSGMAIIEAGEAPETSEAGQEGSVHG